MILRSLKWRLLIGAAVTICAALVVAWAFMIVLFDRHLEHRLEVQLTREATRLVSALQLDAAGRVVLPPTLTDPRLETPASGFYWQASNPIAAVRSRSLWDQTLPPSATAVSERWTLRRTVDPFGGELILIERLIRPDAMRPAVLIQIGENAAEMAGARAEFGRELALYLLGLWIVLAAAAWVQVQLGLRPLRQIERELSDLRLSPSARLPRGRLVEIDALVDAINGLAQARDDDLSRARRRAADLAHGLKTPLAALSARLEQDSHVGRDLGGVVAAIRSAIDRELARSRAATIAPGSVQIAETVEGLIGVLEQTETGEAIIFTNEISPKLTATVSREDLQALLGPLLENAAKYARREVRVTARLDGRDVVVAIDDDGPGIPAAELAIVSRRGARLDESAPGQGLGLAIAEDLSHALGGRLILARSLMGGLNVVARLPAAQTTITRALSG